MPLYEYVSRQDGEVIELIRPMAAADEPVEDPKGQGRTFVRRQSTFAAKGGPGAAGSSLLSGNSGGCCPCGKSRGSCGSN